MPPKKTVKTAKDFFEGKMNHKLSKNPESVEDFDCIFEFVVDDKTWHLDLRQKTQKKGPPQIQSGAHKDKDCQLCISEENFQKLIHGELNIPWALVTGKIKISGQKSLALQLKELFT